MARLYRAWNKRTGAPAETKFVAFISNLPQFHAQMLAIEYKVARVVMRSGIKAAAEPIKEKWAELIPNTTGRGEGYYRNSLKVRTRSTTRMGREEDSPGDSNIVNRRVVTGGKAVIYPAQVPGVPDDEQPARYAGVLEYGGRLTPAQHSSYIPPRPSARPAVELAGPAAVDALADELQRILP